MASEQSQLPRLFVCKSATSRELFSSRGPRGGCGGGGVGRGRQTHLHGLAADGGRDSQISVFSLREAAKSSRLTQTTSSPALSGPPPMPDRAACFLSCAMRDACPSRGLRPRSR